MRENWESYIDENGIEYWIVHNEDGTTTKVSKEFLKKCFEHSW